MTAAAVKPLRLQPDDRDTPLRVRPCDGDPRCLVEQLAQHVWAHKLLWWIAAMSTLAVALQLGLGETLHRAVWG